VLRQLVKRHEVGMGLACFVLDRPMLPAVCDQPVIPSLVVLLGGPLWIGQRCDDRRDALSDLVLRCLVPWRLPCRPHRDGHDATGLPQADPSRRHGRGAGDGQSVPQAGHRCL